MGCITRRGPRDAADPQRVDSNDLRIRHSQLLVAWSKTSVQSGPVLDEVEWALKKNNGLKFLPVIVEEGTQPPPHLWSDEGVDLSQWNGDPKDALFERVRVAIENPWSQDNGMALIRDVKLMKTIRGFVKRPKVQVEPLV